jgi:hypothetical protein
MTDSIKPNLYQLQSRQLHVSYSTSGFDGKPHFTYQDTHQTKSFSGDEISVAETALGREVTVYLVRTVDTGATSFTLLIPNVNLDASKRATINTYAITTIHKRSPIPAFNIGQTDIYSTAALRGTASFVVF